MGWDVSTPRKRCACRSDQGSGAMENDQKAIKNEGKNVMRPQTGKLRVWLPFWTHFGSLSGLFWHPRGGRKTKDFVVVSSVVCRGSFWAPWVAMGPPRPPGGVPKPMGRRHGGCTWALGNLAKTEPGALNHLVFFC